MESHEEMILSSCERSPIKLWQEEIVEVIVRGIKGRNSC